MQGEAGCKENSRAERSREIINGGTVGEAHPGPHGVQIGGMEQMLSTVYRSKREKTTKIFIMTAR